MDVCNRRYHLNRFEHHVALFNDPIMNGLHQLLLLLEMIREVSQAHVQFIGQVAHGNAYKAFRIEKLHGRSDDALLGS